MISSAIEADLCCSLDQGLAPFAHIADGCIHLIMVRKCSPVQYLRFLASIPRNGVIPEDFPYVDTVDATAVRVQPIGGSLSLRMFWSAADLLILWVCNLAIVSKPVGLLLQHARGLGKGLATEPHAEQCWTYFIC